MSLFFWRKDSRDTILDNRLNQLEEKVQQIKEITIQVNQTLTENSQWQEDCNRQLTKLTRLQYKSSQETQGKLEQVVEKLLTGQQWQEKYEDSEKYSETLMREHQSVLNLLLGQLDDFDRICAGFAGAEKDAWQPFFTEWVQKIINALAEMGIYEIDVLGKVFDPRIAEGVGTLFPSLEATTPALYEVAEIVKRGFINREGKLLRKAQVITYKEGKL